MGSKAIIRLTCHFIMTKSCQTLEALTAWCSGKAAYRHGKAVDDRDPPILWNLLAQRLPQLSFHSPQVSRLA